MPPQIAPPRLSPEHALQVAARCGARRGTREQKVSDDRIQQRSHERAPQRRREADDQPHHERRASLLVAAPVVHVPERIDTMNVPWKTRVVAREPWKLARSCCASCAVKWTLRSRRWSGSTGCRNFADRIARSVKPRVWIAPSTASSNTTAGTTGWPGKCP